MGKKKSETKLCPWSDCTNPAIISPRFGVLPCDKHQRENVQVGRGYQFATLTQSARINQERDEFGADLLQPWEPDGITPNREFLMHYPERAADYFDGDDIKDI